MRNQNTKSQKYSTEEPALESRLELGACSHSPSSQGDQRVTHGQRRCLITLLLLNLISSNNTKTEYFQLKTPSNRIQFIQGEMGPTLVGQQMPIISLPNAVQKQRMKK